MKALILADGNHSNHRFAPGAPTSFLPILNKPLIRHQLRVLRLAGFQQVVVWTESAELQDYFADGRCEGMQVICARQLADWNAGEGPLLVLAGDVLPGRGLADLMEHHRCASAAVTAAVQGEAQSLAGMFAVAAGVPEQAVLPRLLSSSTPEGTAAFTLRDGTMRIATADAYMAATRMLLERLDGGIESAAQHLRLLAHNVWAADSNPPGPAHVAPDATITGPVLLGHNCSIGSGATVVGPAVLGDATMICRNAHVENSCIWPGAAIGAHARVIDSIITRCFTIGPGAAFEHCIALDRSARRAFILQPGSYAIEHSPRGTAARVM